MRRPNLWHLDRRENSNKNQDQYEVNSNGSNKGTGHAAACPFGNGPGLRKKLFNQYTESIPENKSLPYPLCMYDKVQYV